MECSSMMALHGYNYKFMSDILFPQRIYNGNAPKWFKITKSYADFSAASLTNSIPIYSLPFNSLVHACAIIPTMNFVGGLISAYTVSVGIGSGADVAKYGTAFNVLQAVGGTVFGTNNLLGMESTNGTVNITATATSITGLLNTATQGSVDIYLLVSTLP